MSETCWYMRFGVMGSAECQNEAKWKSSPEVIARSPSPPFAEAVRWCDLHKQAGDVPIQAASQPSNPET